MSEFTCRLPFCAEPVTVMDNVCDTCWADRVRQLDELPDLYVRAYALLTPGSRIQEISTISVSRPGSRVPFSMVAFDALSYAYDVVTDWARVVLERETGQPVEFVRRSNGRQFDTAVSALRGWDARWLAAPSFAGDYVFSLYMAHRRLVQVARDDATRHLSVVCPVCNNFTVVIRNAAEYGACLTCRTIWSQAQIYRVLLPAKTSP